MSSSLRQSLQDQRRCMSAQFCMPGHKGQLDPLDLTEVGEVDNLLHPQGALAQAHARCAMAYGAKRAHFSVNGSSAGVMALLCAAAGEGDLVLLSGDAHLSAASGLIHSGSDAVILPARQDERGMPLPASVDDVSAALNAHPAIRAVMITSPNYYGLCADIPALAALCRQYGALLLVDGAHGAHFGFHPALPLQPTQADGWVVSAHKTLHVPNQGAMLLLGQDSRLDEGRLFDALARFQTTSPSWPLLCALDDAVTSLVATGQQGYDRLLASIERLRHRLHGTGLALLSLPHDPQDPTRLVIDCGGQGLSGFHAAALLEQRGVFVEMADARFLVLIATPADEESAFSLLGDALCALPKGDDRWSLPPLARTTLSKASPRRAAYGTMEPCPLAASVGRISARALCAYPPGSAMVMPGECITEDQVKALLALHAQGASLTHVEAGQILVKPQSEHWEA